MTRNEANQYLAAILLACEGDGAPEGVMYAALLGKLDLSDFQGLLGIAESVKLVTRKSHYVTLTPKGVEMVGKIRAHAKAAS